MTLTAKDVAEITRLLEESTFEELQIETEGFKLTLRRGGAASSAVPQQAAPAAAGTASPPPPAAVTTASEDCGTGVPAPLLGTFYRAPKPGAAPYVQIGSPVSADTIIGIIEVMKLMNTVRAG